MSTSDLVANLLAMSDWIDSDQQADILRKAATALEASRITDAEREALHWFAHYGLPEHRAATLRGLLERLEGGK
jgi:ABC-type nitrate/sulfonate/bicarbonate transport system substrate-binding protein